jgi:hypothetical protein
MFALSQPTWLVTWLPSGSAQVIEVKAAAAKAGIGCINISAPIINASKAAFLLMAAKT